MINAEIFPPLISLLTDAEFDIKKEAAWVVSLVTSGGSDEQIKYEDFFFFAYVISCILFLICIVDIET